VRIPRSFTVGLVLAAVTGGLTGLTACTDDQDPAKADGKTSKSASATRSSPVTPSFSPPPRKVIRTSDEACDFTEPFKADEVKAYLPDGPAYSGKGPHPAVLFKSSDYGDDAREPQLPDKWLPAYFGDDTQLVVCQYNDNSHDSRDIGTCTYIGGSPNLGDGKAEVRSARYTYRVFEARTGKLVTTFAMNGTTSLEDTCPEEAYYPTAFYQLVEGEDLADKLRPLIEGERP
jgi:hypothetical protein